MMNNKMTSISAFFTCILFTTLCLPAFPDLGGARTMEIGPIRNQNLISGRGTTKNKNRPHQPTIKFTGFLPIKFLPASCTLFPDYFRKPLNRESL